MNQPKYLELLHILADEAREDDPNFPPRATSAELDTFASLAKEKLGREVPQEYLEFLGRLDGYGFNGAFLFSTGGPKKGHVPPVFHAKDHHVQPIDFLWIGHTELFYYGFSYRVGQWIARELETGEPTFAFESFDDLMCGFLREMLGLYDDEDEEEDTASFEKDRT